MLCCASSALRADDDKPPAPATESKKSDAPKKEASTNAAPDKKEEAKGAASTKEPKDELSETTNSVTINGVTVKYKATAGTLVIKDEEGKAACFVFLCRLHPPGRTPMPSERPVTFSFNGGPGSSSVWLHLGLLGPRRVFLKEDGGLPPPPFHLVNNEYSLLDRIRPGFH